MRKSDQLREVFKELRRVLGKEIAAIDVARLAHFLLRSYRNEDDDVDDDGLPSDSRAFLHLPVDEAMRDGGWKVLLFEGRAMKDPDRLDPADRLTFERQLQKYLGPEWQSRFPPG